MLGLSDLRPGFIVSNDLDTDIRVRVVRELCQKPDLREGSPNSDGALPYGRASDTEGIKLILLQIGRPFNLPFLDLLKLALRNLREAKLRATLTSMGVIVGVAVIVTMISFGLGLQRNLLSRFKALDLFS